WGAWIGFSALCPVQSTRGFAQGLVDASARCGVVARVCGRPHRFFGLAVPGGRVVAVVAARQGSSFAFGRHTVVRRHSGAMPAILASLLTVVLGVVFAAGLGIAASTPVAAQGFVYNAPHTR